MPAPTDPVTHLKDGKPERADGAEAAPPTSPTSASSMHYWVPTSGMLPGARSLDALDGSHTGSPRRGAPATESSLPHATTTATEARPDDADWDGGLVFWGDAGTSERGRLDRELDAMAARGELLRGQYAVLGSARHRRGGSQGCVQFVRHAATLEAFAVKFFLDGAAFRRERDLYKDPALREMMAATHAVVDGGARGRASAAGFAFPPYIVIQRGEPLDEWSERVAKVTCAGLDLVNVFQALWQVLVAPCAVHSDYACHSYFYLSIHSSPRVRISNALPQALVALVASARPAPFNFWIGSTMRRLINCCQFVVYGSLQHADIHTVEQLPWAAGDVAQDELTVLLTPLR
jgi:hypothetical protein